MTPQTETLDRLYLEWSQFTRARTKRELTLRKPLEFAAANGANWTLEDWNNWRLHHAEVALKESEP
jgi:hypothetical protein